MRLIGTCELTGVNPFDNLTALQTHAEDVARHQSDRMAWIAVRL